MHVVVLVAAGAAALIHAYFFVLESLWFMRPSVHGRFGLTSEDQARAVRSFAYNQGFYNLFLAVGAIAGIVATLNGAVEGGRAVTLFACGSMVAAGVVLVTHNAKFASAAAIQAVPPLIAVLGILFLR